MGLRGRGLKRVDKFQRLWCFCHVQRNGFNDLEPNTGAKAKTFGINEQWTFLGEINQYYIPKDMDFPVLVPV